MLIEIISILLLRSLREYTYICIYTYLLWLRHFYITSFNTFQFQLIIEEVDTKFYFSFTHGQFNAFRSKIRTTAKRNPSEFNLEDIFGTVSFAKDKYPNTVPYAKGSIRDNILIDIFDNNDLNKPNHSSASVAPRRRNQQPQVFVSNNKWELLNFHTWIFELQWDFLHRSGMNDYNVSGQFKMFPWEDISKTTTERKQWIPEKGEHTIPNIFHFS